MATTQFGGVKSLIPTFKSTGIKPVKNTAPVGGGAVAGLPQKPKLLNPTPATKGPMMSVNPGMSVDKNAPNMSTLLGPAKGSVAPLAQSGGMSTVPVKEPMMSVAPGMSIDKNAPNMSTLQGPVKGSVTPLAPVGGMSTVPGAKTTPKTDIPKIGAPRNTGTSRMFGSSSTTTDTTTPTGGFEDVNGNMHATQAEADIASKPPVAETPTTDTTTPQAETPTTPEAEVTAPDYVGQDIALTQAEYMQKNKEDEEFQRQQRGLQVQVDTLTGEMSQLQSSETIRKTADDLDRLKHNIAYLGSQGQPGQSAVKMEAISKQITEAETVFKNLKRLETDKESMRTLGLEYDAASFERQMVILQDNLNSNVNAAIQEAMNGLNAEEMAGKLDSIEEVEALRGTLFQNLDKAIAGKVVANATDRKLIIDRYNQTIANTEAFVKNKSVVNKEMSTALGYYVDGNGNPVLNAQGVPITMPKEAPMEPIFDKDSGSLLTFSTGADGKIVTTVQKILAGTQAAGDPRKQSSDGTYYRTNAQGQLETSGTPGAKQITTSERLSIMKSYALGEITEAEKNSMLGGGGGGYNAPAGATPGVSGYTGPSYKAASFERAQAAFTQVVSQGNNSIGGQCGAFVNNYLQDMGIGRLFSDPIDKKKAVMNSTQATVGSVAIMDSPSKPQYGHVGIVTSVNADGTVTLKQSNKDGSEKVFTSTVSQSKIYGYFDPQIPQSEALMSGGTQAASTTDQSYLYGDFTSTLTPQGAKVFDSYTEEDKLNVMMIVNGDALVSDIAKGAKGTLYAKKLLGLATKVDPTFSENKNKSRYNFIKNRDNPTGKAFINRSTINTALGHTAEMKNAVAGLGNTNVNMANSFKNIIKNNIGNPSVPDFNIILTALAGEMAGLYKGASPTDQETEKWYNSISANYSPKTLNQLLDRVTTLASDRIRSLTTEYKTSMGKLPDEPLVQDYFLEQLRNAGINVSSIDSIPGATDTSRTTTTTSTGGGRRNG